MARASEEASRSPRRPGRGRRRLWRWILAVALLLALVLHQPILRAAVRLAAVRMASRVHVGLSLEVTGSVWTHLTLRHIEARATGESPVEHISIERLRVEYSLWKLLRQGPNHALTFYNLRNARLELEPRKGNADQKQRLVRMLRGVLEQPLMRADRAQIENFNVTLRTPKGSYVFGGVHALLDPEKPGYVRVGELRFPGGGTWRGIDSPATYAGRHLVLRDFDVGDAARVHRLELDASRRDKGIRYLSFEGTLLGGDLGIFLWQQAEPGQPARAQFTASLSNLPLAAVGGYLGWKAPLEGMLQRGWVQMSGDPARPAAWEGQVQASVTGGRAGGVALGDASLYLTVGGGVARLEKLECGDGKNRLAFQAERPMPPVLNQFRLAGLEAAFTLDAPDLPALHEAFTAGRVRGHGKVRLEEGGVVVEGEAEAAGVAGRDFGVTQGKWTVNGRYPLPLRRRGALWYEGLSGHFSGEAAGVRWREFAARGVKLDLPVEANAARPAVTLELESGDRLQGSARVDLQKPFDYEGRLAGSVSDLSAFQPFFRFPVAGALEIDWHGTGQIAQMRHSGEGRLALRGGKAGMLTGVEGEVAGVYSPEAVEVSALRVRSDQGSLEAAVRLRDQRLHVERLRLEAARIGAVTGRFTLPVDLRTPTHPETVFPRKGALEGSLILEPVELAKTPLPGARPEWGLKGTLSGSLTAGGTLEKPEVTGLLSVRGLQSAAAAKLAPAAGGLELHFKDGRVALTGSLAQPGLSPLLLKGAMPLDLPRVLAERRLDPATPISCAVKLPPSPADLFTPFLPGVRRLEGRLSVDAAARGTLAKPVYFGGMALDIAAIRFQNAKAPLVDRFLADLRFDGTELTLHRFSGEVAGGPFFMTGKVRLDHPAEPVLDLRFQSQGTLLVRNDTLTLRTDSDLRIAGPFKTAAVTGKIGITKSRFFREVDILPIGLPGRPAPKPARGWGRMATEVAPFRDWSYRVAIVTAEPFVVKGNLANGTIEANLTLGGTGLAPTLEGTARIENFEASLPFSRLTVDHGALYFRGGGTIDPVLDIHGSSRIRDYNVNVYLYGTASEPQTLFTSEPSLPQEEVVALLATGATTRDFMQNNEAVAGRAAALVFQDIYRKVFRRRAAASGASNPLDRFSLDVGGVDPRSGKQELMGRVKLSDQFQFGAGVDVQGDARMQLQYLLRFR